MNVTAAYQKSRMPLYLQVAKLMRQLIESGAWAFGEQIPTLDRLEEEYHVSRITLRAALDQLEALGIVRRTRGVGTFVAKDLSKERWFKLPMALDELVDAVGNLQTRLLPIDDHSATTLVPAFAYGDVGPAYHRMRRVHYRGDQPFCVIDVYLDRSLYDKNPQAFSSKPIVPQLVHRRGLRIGGARQIVRIMVSDESTARHLEIGVGEPIAHVSRSIVDAKNRIVYYAEIQYPAQMFQIDIDLMK